MTSPVTPDAEPSPILRQKQAPLGSWVLVYFSLVLIQLFVHARLVDSPNLAIRTATHLEFFAHVLESPYQYRVLSFWGPELFRHMGLSLFWSYLVWRGIWLLAAAVLLHRFFQRYLAPPWPALGTVLLFALLPLSYLTYAMQESDIPNLVFYLAAYHLIANRKDIALVPLLAVSMLNRETPILLPLLWLLYRWDELPWPQTAIRFTLYVLTTVGTYLGIRGVYGNLPSEQSVWYLPTNIVNVLGFLFLLLWFGAYLDSAIRRGGTSEKFIQRGLLFAPFFFAGHFVIGNIEEMRYFLPILPFFFVAAFLHWQNSSVSPGLRGRKTQKRSFRVMYGLLFAAFVAGLRLYGSTFSRLYVQDIAPQRRALWYQTRGQILDNLGLHDEARQQWDKGRMYLPPEEPPNPF